jgi:hypothetical protein
MGIDNTLRWKSIERLRPTLFLVGGSLLVAHTGILAVQAFSNLPTPLEVFGPAGHFVALVGLFGLYPALANRTPTTTRIAGAVAILALSCWSLIIVGRVLVASGAVSSLSDPLPAVFFMLTFGSTILTYCLFGVASIRVEPRGVSLLVFAPGVLISMALVGSAVSGMTDFAALVVAGGLALSVLTLGIKLRTWDRPTDGTVSASDATAG